MALATRQVPLYSSKFSKRTFTQPQLVVLYCLKLGVTLPRASGLAGGETSPPGGRGPQAAAALHQKAFQRLGAAVWHVLHRLSVSLLLGDGIAAVSGWDRSYASRSYTQRMKLKLRSLNLPGSCLVCYLPSAKDFYRAQKNYSTVGQNATGLAAGSRQDAVWCPVSSPVEPWHALIVTRSSLVYPRGHSRASRQKRCSKSMTLYVEANSEGTVAPML
jgi:hypothetical protein